MIIYKATNIINNKIYIGQTVNDLKVRRKHHENAHLYPSCQNRSTIFTRAIAKHGKENFTWEVIDKADSLEELNQKEEYWIEYYESVYTSNKGYNIKFGGDNHLHSERTKQLISEAQIGEKNHMYGITGAEHHSSKRVIDIHTKEIFDSATECAKSTGASVSKVCAVCRGDRGSTLGRVFRYIDESNNIMVPHGTMNQSRKRVVDNSTGDIYNNATHASKSLGKKDGRVLTRNLKETGYCYLYDRIWSYEGTEVPENISNKKKASDYVSKGVINLTDNIPYDSIAEAARSVSGSKSGLARALRLNKECLYKNKKWSYR